MTAARFGRGQWPAMRATAVTEAASARVQVYWTRGPGGATVWVTGLRGLSCAGMARDGGRSHSESLRCVARARVVHARSAARSGTRGSASLAAANQRSSNNVSPSQETTVHPRGRPCNLSSLAVAHLVRLPAISVEAWGTKAGWHCATPRRPLPDRGSH